MKFRAGPANHSYVHRQLPPSTLLLLLSAVAINGDADVTVAGAAALPNAVLAHALIDHRKHGSMGIGSFAHADRINSTLTASVILVHSCMAMRFWLDSGFPRGRHK